MMHLLYVECPAQVLPIVQEKSSQQSFILARQLYDDGRYADALVIFQELLGADPENANLNFLVGDCYLLQGGFEQEARPFLEKAVRNIVVDYQNHSLQRSAPVFAFEKLGDVYYHDYRFDDALVNYRVLKTYLDGKRDKVLQEAIDAKIARAMEAGRILDAPLKMVLTEIPFVNVISFSDFGAIMVENGGLIFFNRRREETGATNQGSDIYMMRKTEQKWGRPLRMSFVNSEADDMVCWASKDGDMMLIASDRDGSFDLYLSERKGKSMWTMPARLNSTVNSRADETSGWLSGDHTTLYFVSNRKDGFGGKDIYRTARQADGTWGPALNLGAGINTVLDEESPFLTQDGQRLYFSSRGRGGMGGYDVFSVTMPAGDALSAPVNAGYPVNTVGDDLFYRSFLTAKPNYLITRARVNSSASLINALNDSENVATNNEVREKKPAAEKPKLKLVPKTLKY
ncbi:MAG TPA: tetratricopeptide repeat protein [Bacteroidales bacterium]|nr:tetratricopeptide repeat protein [Bacteroidales bacterium]HSA43789.1 tetratricopeptide repeat protein [Bacteroidales bacterium]